MCLLYHSVAAWCVVCACCTTVLQRGVWCVPVVPQCCSVVCGVCLLYHSVAAWCIPVVGAISLQCSQPRPRPHDSPSTRRPPSPRPGKGRLLPCAAWRLPSIVLPSIQPACHAPALQHVRFLPALQVPINWSSVVINCVYVLVCMHAYMHAYGRPCVYIDCIMHVLGRGV